MENKGLVHIYCGNGKGKTTAAVGLAVRCAGGGGRVLFYQFLKDGKSGEINSFRFLDGITVFSGYKSTKFSFNMTEHEKRLAAEHYMSDFNKIRAMVNNSSYDMLVLDEAIHAVNLGYITLSAMLGFIDSKPEVTELVLTGRNPSKELIDRADYISEITKIKHPFDRGVNARKYIEL